MTKGLAKVAADQRSGGKFDFPSEWRTTGLTPKREKELHMWKQWREGGETPEHMEPLLTSLQPLVKRRMRDFMRGVPIHRETVQAAADQNVIQSLRSYDPTKAKLHTWVTSNLRGLSRYVISNQNLVRVTESRAQLIGPYQRARAALADELGRQPTALEIQARINLSPEREGREVDAKSLQLLGSEVRRDLLSSASLEDPFSSVRPRERELLKLLPYELDPTEMQVYEYLMGLNGKPKLTNMGEVARRLRWSPSKVSQVKKRIAKKYEEYRFE